VRRPGSKLRERVELSKEGRALLQGRVGAGLDTQESEGQMLQRVMPELMGLRNVLALNGEAYQIDADFKTKVDREFDAMLARAGGASTNVLS
jgi:hypothetical protein